MWRPSGVTAIGPIASTSGVGTIGVGAARRGDARPAAQRRRRTQSPGWTSRPETKGDRRVAPARPACRHWRIATAASHPSPPPWPRSTPHPGSPLAAADRWRAGGPAMSWTLSRHRRRPWTTTERGSPAARRTPTIASPKPPSSASTRRSSIQVTERTWPSARGNIGLAPPPRGTTRRSRPSA